MQTQCPHCQTIFKVSDENLKIADGFVRCGLCKEVFNALEKDKQDNKDAAVTQTKSSDSAKAPNKINQPDDTDSVEFVLEKSNEVSASENQDNLSTSDKPSEQKEKATSSENNLQNNLSTAASETKKSDAVTSQSTEKQTNAREEKLATPEVLNTEHPAQKIKTPIQASTTEQTNNNNTEKQASKSDATIIAEPTPTTAVASNHKEKETQYQPDKIVDNNLFDGVQSKLIPDEYRIPELHNTYSLWRDLTWSIAILILTASLFVEYAWFNRNELISHPQLRPVVTQLCDITNCDIMELRKPSEIEMTTRNIYTHPNVKNALMISGTLINHAEFEQPYPDILVDFSNVRGEVIASRTFTPGDYLQIKATSLRLLPPRVSIDFNMEIQDPGNKAMTYEFSFL